jgi:hypothetical protein
VVKRPAKKSPAPPAKKTSAPPAKKTAPVVAAPAPVVAAPAPVIAVAPPAPPPVEEPEHDEPAAISPLPARLVELFRLSRSEQRAIYHLLVSDTPLAVSALADRLDLELAATIALLGPEGTLRGRALVEAEARAGLGFLLPCDLVTVGRALHLFCGESEKIPVDDATLFASHAPGVTYFAAPPPGTAWAQELIGDKRPPAVAEVVRDHLGAGHAVALWLGGVGPTDVMPLIQALRARLVRPVVLVESALLAGWPQPELFAALRRLRRDADLRGAVVVVSDVKLLGGAYRALCQPRPVGQTAPVVLCGSDDKPPLGKLPQGAAFETPLVIATTSLLRSALPAAPTNAAEENAVDPALLASREEARRRAAHDAALAMGRPIPPELNEPSKAVPPPPAAATRQVPVASPIYKPPPPASYTPPPPAAEEEPPPGARPMNPRLAAALAKAGLPPAGSAAYQTEQHTQRPSVGGPAAPPPAEAPPVAAPPPAAEAPDAASAEPPGAVPEDDQPPLPLEENASLDEVLRVIRTTPNYAQRIQLMRGLAGKRAPAVIQMFRSFTTSAHPGVRTAAEAGMASLFGANWNRTRAISAPTQPPRSDDGGRGPGGAF